MKGDCYIALLPALKKVEVRSMPQPPCRSKLASVVGVVVMALAGCAQSGMLSSPATKRLVLDSNGIADVHFGLPKTKTVAALQASLGKPNATGTNTGCGPAVTEVAWHDLIAEFRHGTFTGYRYVSGGYPLTTAGSPHDPVSPMPRTPALTTARGITLGSTLRELRAAYPGLIQSGALKWTAPNGLVFVEASQTNKPTSPTAKPIRGTRSTVER
jgi:hypothetical protein